MKRNELLIIIFTMCTIALMLFSKNIAIRIICGIIILIYMITAKTIIYIKTKKATNELKANKKTYILCRENKYFLLLIGFSFILNAMTSISNIKHKKNMEIFLNEELPISSFIDFINRITITERVDIFINIILIVMAITFIIDWFMSFAVISDDKIIFHNGYTFDFSQITEIKYKDPLFSKKKIIRIHTKKNAEELILKLDDFERVKEYLQKVK